MGQKALRDRIYELMRQRGMRQQDLVRISKRPRSTIEKLLRCEIANPSIDLLRDIARALHVHYSDLVGHMYSDYRRPIRAYGRTAKYDKYDSAFIADVTYPDNSAVASNQEFEKVWEIQNTGGFPWVGFRLVNTDDPAMPVYMQPSEREIALGRVESGETTQIRVYLKAPGFAGSFISRWKLVDADGELVFPDKDGIWCQIVVEDI